MTLDEAIQHCFDVADAKVCEANYIEHVDSVRFEGDSQKCIKCANEHLQLGKWLRNYQDMLEVFKNADGTDYTDLDRADWFDELMRIYWKGRDM